MLHQQKQYFIDSFKSLLASSFVKNDEVLKAFFKLIDEQPNDFWGKKSHIAHMTASCLVTNEDVTEVLLTDHKNLKKWLQLGGHWCDFEDFPSKNVLEAALKEVEEEAYGDNPIPQTVLLSGFPLDLDIHSVGDHTHYDICFLSQVSKSIPIHVSPESNDVDWISIEKIIDNGSTFESRLVTMCKTLNELKSSIVNSKLF